MAAEKKLRTGFTTGACATAAAKAALLLWHDKICPENVEIILPKNNQQVFFKIHQHRIDGDDDAQTTIVKDAGDDPDITHGALISSRITMKPRKISESTLPKVYFFAGKGVGIITKAGLPLPVGEPAINPVPRAMITQHLLDTAQALNIQADFDVEISIADGEALALKTWNPRLGIIGGLSVLGTSGIVRPYSCSAWIHSIHRGIDVARAMGLRHIAGATGNLSEAAVQNYYQLDHYALIDMGDFVGGMLKYLRKHPVKRVTIAGGFGKMLKLAAGNADLHSKRSQVDFAVIQAWAQDFGLSGLVCDSLSNANSAQHIWEILQAAQAEFFLEMIAGKAQKTAEILCMGKMGSAKTQIDILFINRAGEVIYPRLRAD